MKRLDLAGRRAGETSCRPHITSPVEVTVAVIRMADPRLEVPDKRVIYREDRPLASVTHRNKDSKHSEWEELRQLGGR